MYKAATIKEQLINLVGWKQNVDSAGVQLTTVDGVDLTTSDSGLYFDGFHPMITFDNLISVAPRFEDLFATSDEINDAFSAWLKAKTEAAILKVVDDWFARKADEFTAIALIANEDLFSVTGNVTAVEPKSNKIVGFEFTPFRSKNMIVKIERIGVQFDTNQTITVRLYKSGKIAPEQTLSIAYTGGGSVQWISAGWELSGEGSYFIAYDDAAVTGNAINGITDHNFFSNGVAANTPVGRFFRAVGFAVNDPDHDPAGLWDLTAMTYDVGTNFGLNLTTSVRCDYTGFVVAQKDLFKTAVGLRVAMDVLRELAFNPQSRTNRNVDNVTRSQILFEIDGDTQGRNDFSLLGQYDRALKSITFDSTGIDKICLPCKRRSTRQRSIGPVS